MKFFFMKSFSAIRLVFIYIFLIPIVSWAQFANLNEPLKTEYLLKNQFFKSFSQTGEKVSSYSIVCDMGMAIPNVDRKDWYTNKPISGLKFELRARIAIYDIDNNIKPGGFVVITKNGQVMTTFKPLGDFINGQWEGDTFNTWTGTEPDVEVFSERKGKSGYAHIDLLNGSGFYYKFHGSSEPDYFLSNCNKIKKDSLPVYAWK